MDSIINDTIDLLTRFEYTPERSLAVDALTVIKELVEDKRMDRVINSRPDILYTLHGAESSNVGSGIEDSIKPVEERIE